MEVYFRPKDKIIKDVILPCECQKTIANSFKKPDNLWMDMA